LQGSTERLKELSRDLREVKTKLQTYKDEKEALQHEHSSFLKDKTRLELHIRDLRDEVEGDASSKQRAEKELASLKEKIQEKQSELNQIKPEYEEMKKLEEECTRQLN